MVLQAHDVYDLDLVPYRCEATPVPMGGRGNTAENKLSVSQHRSTWPERRRAVVQRNTQGCHPSHTPRDGQDSKEAFLHTPYQEAKEVCAEFWRGLAAQEKTAQFFKVGPAAWRGYGAQLASHGKRP